MRLGKKISKNDGELKKNFNEHAVNKPVEYLRIKIWKEMNQRKLKKVFKIEIWSQ